ncbi:hypothetical protein SRRS_15090 [Sporomusa rhizae]|uniref:hypothetical protein n=1 Tax=Sporomusa rhizae TaxID=357999 RepID=UPI003529E07C
MANLNFKNFIVLLILSQFIFLYSIIPVEAAVIKTYDGMIKLHPVGWSAGYILFRGNRPVTFNERNEVISGTLEGFTALRPVGEAIFYGTSDGFVLFKGGSEVSFDEKGKVTVGTLANDTEFLLVDGKEGTVKYKSNTVVTFKDGGSLGTLVNNSDFRPVGYSINNAINDQAGYISFKGNTYIRFNMKGEVIEGTLLNDTNLCSIDGSVKTYRAGASVHFNDKGEAY